MPQWPSPSRHTGRIFDGCLFDWRRRLFCRCRRQRRLGAGILGVSIRPRRLRRRVVRPLACCRRFGRRWRFAFGAGRGLQRRGRLREPRPRRIERQTRERRCGHACTGCDHNGRDREALTELARFHRGHGVHRNWICGNNGHVAVKVPAWADRYSLVLESQVALRTPGWLSSLTSTASSSFGSTAVDTSVATISRWVSLSSFTSTSPTG